MRIQAKLDRASSRKKIEDQHDNGEHEEQVNPAPSV